MTGIDISQDGPVLRLTIDRPESRNSMNLEMMHLLIDRVEVGGCAVVVARGEFRL